MSLLRDIMRETAHAVNSGHAGLFSTADIALLLRVPLDTRLRKLLSRATAKGVLNRVCRDLYVNPVTPPKPVGLLERIAHKLHWEHLVYVSMESELSHTGDISQVIMGRLTVMTTGRKGTVKTPYGLIEFTHTKRSPQAILGDVYVSPVTGVLHAKPARARADLKAVGRNLNMLDIKDAYVAD